MSNLTAASRLRLASAERRISAFLEQIALLRDSSFPHEDGIRVLEKIAEVFERLKRQLDIPPSADDAFADRQCLHVAVTISKYTETLGLVLRSTNVRNAFELHHVLKGMVEKLLGRETDLLISSEWNFIPFTYPVGIDLLDSVVLIGSPAPESENALIVPLAGHEIGHSVWRVEDVEGQLAQPVLEAVGEAIATLDGKEDHQDDLVARSNREVLTDRCAKLASKQLEEIYCDLVGLHIFGESYLYAFDYLLGPGDGGRSLDYPSDATRMQILVKASEKLDVMIDPDLKDHWTEANALPEYRRHVEVIDAVVSTQTDKLIEIVAERMGELDVSPPTNADITLVLEAFARNQPFAQHAELGALISAGWRLLREKDDLTGDDERKQYKILCDLVWKSIEVSEYFEKTERPNA